MKKALDKIKESLNPNGKVIICDFFSLGNKRDKIFKGGHKWTRFEEIFLDGEFTIRSNVDITEATSPNVALFANLINEVGFPTGSLLREYLEYKFPRLTKFLLWKFRDSLNDISTKYDHQTLNIENFLNSKTYRLILLSI